MFDVKKHLSQVYNDRKKLLVHIFAFSVLVSIVFLVFFGKLGPAEHQQLGTDYLNAYRPIAQSLLSGRGFTYAHSDYIIPPGYPVYIALVLAIDGLVRLPEH